MTPEPECLRTATNDFYKDADVAAFICKSGGRDVALRRPRPVQGRNASTSIATLHASRSARRTDPTLPDRLNFGGRHVAGVRCPPTGLTMRLVGFDTATGKITDANGAIALVNDAGEVAASWSFRKILEHWSHKHAKAVYVPSKLRLVGTRSTASQTSSKPENGDAVESVPTGRPPRQYAYGHKVRLALRTDSLRLLRAFASGAMYYDPGIKLEVLAHGHQHPPHRRGRKSEPSFAWRPGTSPRFTRRWRRWRCKRSAASTPLHRASASRFEMNSMPTILRELKRPEGRAPSHPRPSAFIRG